jgi:hypothetical protein
MPIVEIDGKKVHVEEGSESAKVAAEYLSKNPDNARALFDEAHRNHSTGIAHWELPNMHSDKDLGIAHHVTMIHNGDGTYTLQKRHGY